MKFKTLLEIANEGYSSTEMGADLTKINPNGKSRFAVGDTLAEFVVRELHDTFDQFADNDEQLAEAIRVMRVAAGDLNQTIAALEAARVRA